MTDTNQTGWTVQTTKHSDNSLKSVYIAKDGSPFFAKGVAYSPVPIGGSFHYEPQVGDWFHGPWSVITARDLPEMNRLGINSFRTYAMWWWQPTKDLQTMRSIDQKSPQDTTGNEAFNQRSTFFEQLDNNNLNMMIGIALNGGDVFDGGSDEVKFSYGNFYLQTAEKLASEYANKDSVMGFCLANEQNQAGRNTSAAVWAYYYLMKQRVLKGLGGVKKLISIAWQNDPSLYNGTTTVDLSDENIANVPAANGSGDTAIDLQAAARDLKAALVGTAPTDLTKVPVEQIISTICDVWGLNIYSGMDTSLQTFDVNVYQTSYHRPLLVTEWGYPGTENTPSGAVGPAGGTALLQDKDSAGMQDAAAKINDKINDMNSYLKFVCGGTYFEWTDEWWKNDSNWNAIPKNQQDYLNNKIANWQQGDPVPAYEVGSDGTMTFTNGSTGYPQYTFVWDGDSNPQWPEEGWGLYSVAPNGRQAWDNPWNLKKNAPQNPDNINPRQPLIDALTGSGSTYDGKGYPMLEANYETLNSAT